MDPKDKASETTDAASNVDQLSALIGAPIAPGTDAAQSAAADAAAAAAAAPKEDAPKGEQPAADAAKPSAEVAAVPKRKLTLGGKEVEVDEDAEGAFRREIDSRAGKWGSEKQRLENEIARLRAENAAATRRKPTEEAIDDDPDDVKPPVEPDDELLNPESPKYNLTKYAEQNREYRRQSRLYTESLVLNGMRAVEQSRQQENATLETQRQESSRRQAVLDRFYTEIAPELSDYREVVGAIYLKHKPELEQLARENPDEAMKQIRKLALARLAKIAEAGRTAEAPPTMGTSRRAAAVKPAPTKEDDEDDGSLSSLVRQGRMKRVQRAS